MAFTSTQRREHPLSPTRTNLHHKEAKAFRQHAGQPVLMKFAQRSQSAHRSYLASTGTTISMIPRYATAVQAIRTTGLAEQETLASFAEATRSRSSEHQTAVRHSVSRIRGARAIRSFGFR